MLGSDVKTRTEIVLEVNALAFKWQHIFVKQNKESAKASKSWMAQQSRKQDSE